MTKNKLYKNKKLKQTPVSSKSGPKISEITPKGTSDYGGKDL